MERLKITSSRHVERHAPQIPAGKKKIKVELNTTLIIVNLEVLMYTIHHSLFHSVHGYSTLQLGLFITDRVLLTSFVAVDLNLSLQFFHGHEVFFPDRTLFNI